MKKDYIILMIVFVGILAVIAWGVYASVNQTCTMGVSGTGANVTFKGSQAQNFCANPQGWQFNNNHFYPLDQPQGVILCDGQLTSNGSSAEYTIRDTGVFNLTGSALCQWFSEGAPSSSQ